MPMDKEIEAIAREIYVWSSYGESSPSPSWTALNEILRKPYYSVATAVRTAAEQVRADNTRELTADDLASALMEAHNVPERARGDSDTIAEAISEAQKILDALPWKLYLQPRIMATNISLIQDVGKEAGGG